MAKLSKDERISLFNKFINESDSYGEGSQIEWDVYIRKGV